MWLRRMGEARPCCYASRWIVSAIEPVVTVLALDRAELGWVPRPENWKSDPRYSGPRKGQRALSRRPTSLSQAAGTRSSMLTDTGIPGTIAVPVALATPMTGPLVSFSAKGTNTQVQTHAA